MPPHHVAGLGRGLVTGTTVRVRWVRIVAMSASSFATVEAYIAAQPAEAQPRLRELRAVIRAAVPDASESISYGMPTYKLPAGPVAHFAAAKRHCALYGSVTDEFAEELRGYKTLKGTVQFPLNAPIPEELVRKLVTARADRLRATGATADSAGF